MNIQMNELHGIDIHDSYIINYDLNHNAHIIH
jgi:hypothetical protein